MNLETQGLDIRETLGWLRITLGIACRYLKTDYLQML